jgi:hypothetical protein
MINFKDLLLLDENSFKNKMSEIDSADLIDYLRNCDDNKIKKEYYRRTELILGNNYYKMLKLAVNKETIKQHIIKKYLLIFLNVFFSSLICVIIFFVLFNSPLNYFLYWIFQIPKDSNNYKKGHYFWLLKLVTQQLYIYIYIYIYYYSRMFDL